MTGTRRSWPACAASDRAPAGGSAASPSEPFGSGRGGAVGVALTGQRGAVRGVEEVDLVGVEPELRALADRDAAARIDARDGVAADAALGHVLGARVLLELAQLVALDVAALEVEVGVD